MTLIIDNHPFQYEIENLCKMFFPCDKIEVKIKSDEDQSSVENLIYTAVVDHGDSTQLIVRSAINGLVTEQVETVESAMSDKEKERRMAVVLYQMLAEVTGIKPPWGILTGVRPAKLIHAWRAKGLSDDEILIVLQRDHLVSEEKSRLLLRTANNENAILKLSTNTSYSLYVAIPFCPTRCKYCSFVSHAIQNTRKLVPEYLELLCQELTLTAKIAEDLQLKLETIYIGGGTPTTLSAPQLRQLLDCIAANFDTKSVREYTIEAGRPDTITREKLVEIKNSDITRVSINPQTLNDAVLQEIGRNHTVQQFREAFALAREIGIDNINTDLIAGLPLDTYESFCATVDGIVQLNPENITVHTLSVKRAADFRDSGAQLHHAADSTAAAMVSYAYQAMIQNGYEPYYLYRQKNMLDNLENIGYAKRGYEGLYNVYIMDETHTILATGASGSTKLKDHATDKLLRIFNFKFPYEYISRYQEILERKGQIYDFFNQKPNGDTASGTN